MVFNPLGIGLSDTLLYAEGSQELQHYLVTPLDLLSEVRARIGQKYRTIPLTDEKPLLLQARDRSIYRNVSYSDPACNIYQARLTLFLYEIRDHLDIVLRYLMRSSLPGLAVMLCLVRQLTALWGRSHGQFEKRLTGMIPVSILITKPSNRQDPANFLTFDNLGR